MYRNPVFFFIHRKACRKIVLSLYSMFSLESANIYSAAKTDDCLFISTLSCKLGYELVVKCLTFALWLFWFQSLLWYTLAAYCQCCFSLYYTVYWICSCARTHLCPTTYMSVIPSADPQANISLTPSFKRFCVHIRQ